MILEFVFLVTGVLVGMSIRSEWAHHRYGKTLEQIDQEMRNELDYYKNLSESLKNDLHWAKLEKEKLHGKKKED